MVDEQFYGQISKRQASVSSNLRNHLNSTVPAKYSLKIFSWSKKKTIIMHTKKSGNEKIGKEADRLF